MLAGSVGCQFNRACVGNLTTIREGQNGLRLNDIYLRVIDTQNGLKKLLVEEIASVASMHTAKIAIVDDDDAVREAMKFLMRSFGYHASTFGSADEFLNSDDVHDTSCLITDVQMPGLSGLDLQDRLIARGHSIPIIFITGYPDENVRARAMKVGAIAFLTKPVNPDDLLGYLGKALQAA